MTLASSDLSRKFAKSKFSLCAWLLAWWSTSSLALVDLKNGNYSNTWVDMVVLDKSGWGIEMTRSYNSRSDFKGIFGDGWCSDFETSLTRSDGDDVLIKECGTGSETHFVRRNSAYSSTNPDYSLKQIDNQSYDLEEKKLNRMRRFQDGKLVLIKAANEFTLVITWKGQQLYSIQANTGQSAVFTYDGEGNIKSTTGSKGELVEYKFSKAGRIRALTSVKNAWGKVYRYSYDAFGNLTRAHWPDGTSIQIEYDEANDWVVSFVDRERCRENYVYKFDRADIYSSEVIKFCEGKLIARKKHHFVFIPSPFGMRLGFYAGETREGHTEIWYEDHGKPAVINRQGRLTYFQYDEQGRITVLTTSNEQTYFSYNTRCGLIASVSTNIAGPESELTEFSYNDNCFLVSVKNRSSAAHFTYDRFLRLTEVNLEGVGALMFRHSLQTSYNTPKVMSISLGENRVDVSDKGAAVFSKDVSPEMQSRLLQAIRKLRVLLAHAESFPLPIIQGEKNVETY